MVSEQVFTLCQDRETVSSVLAEDQSLAPGDAVRRLYGHLSKDLGRNPDEHRAAPSREEEEAALGCGRWGPTRPTSLFLQAFADSLNCLEADPMAGMVSPPLMASHGTMPLTAVAPLADIVRHCSNMIVRAQREVFFVTCSWSPSVARRLIRDALIELSRRAGERGQGVVVKMMFDKASCAGLSDPRRFVRPETFASSSIQLPSPREIPHLEMEVLTMHQLPLGTLHAKFCIVDRRMAAIMSNNIEDNSNMEMMTHLEGPIVDSIYDSALITWDHHFNPPLPSLPFSATEGGLPTADQEAIYLDRGQGRDLDEVAAISKSAASAAAVAAAAAAAAFPEHTPEDPHYDADLAGEIGRVQSCYSAIAPETRLRVVNRRLNLAAKGPVEPTGPDIAPGEEMTPYIPSGTVHPVPMALVSRPPYGWLDSRNINVPQNEAWLSLIRNAKSSVFVQTPDLNAEPLLRAIRAALRRGVEVTLYTCFGYNDAGEMIPGQGGTNDQVAQALVSSLPEDGRERELLRIHNYVGKDQDRPIHQSFRSRACHVKLLIVDGAVGVQGSGNQDTQSWCHSQELNVMVDSEEVCGRWRQGIERNQNTGRFGRVAEDGVWRDAEGRAGRGYMGNPGRLEALVRGFSGMLRKMRDAGNI